MAYSITINQVRNLLLAMANDKRVSPEFIQNFINKLLLYKPIPTIVFKFSFVVRCSPNNIGLGEVFQNVSRCSYNPKIDYIPLQRCNYPKQQVFYAAVTSDAIDVKG